MPQIGQFTAGKKNFVGNIHTLTIMQELTIVPAEESDTENAPDYRVHRGDADGPEVGAAWKRTGEKAGEYLSVLLDDPALPQPIRATSGIEAMRSCVIIALKGFIPLFAEKPSHPFVPLDRRTAGARSAGQGRPALAPCP